ncbi:MAG: hypothetical protein IPK85_05245 [Gemmatimonadetes bacterium]|nr:hypothetical protein [Gemmatimonadota bacterium]
MARRSILDDHADPTVAPSDRAIGVLPFASQGLPEDLAVLGYGLADLLTADLAVSRDLTVLERVRSDAILRELALQEARVDSALRVRLGRIMGVGRLVIGDLSANSPTVLRIGTQITRVATTEVAPGAALETDVDRIIDAEKRLAFALLDSLGVTLTPAERVAIEQRRTENLAAFLAYSRGVREELLLGIRRARLQYRRALQLDPGFKPAADNLAALAQPSVAQGLQDIALISIQGITPRGPTRPSDASDPAFRERILTQIIIMVNVP